MRNITIRSYRNATEVLAFEWPDRQPNTAGEFIGKVVCNVINPAWPKIMQYRAKWAVDTALFYARDDSFGTVFNDLARLKTWLRYAPLQIKELTENKSGISRTDQVEVIMHISEEAAMRVEELEGPQSSPQNVPAIDREFEFERSGKEIVSLHPNVPIFPPARAVPSKVCAIL